MLRLIEDTNYTHGVVSDTPSWLLPPGALAAASNMIFDVPGIARQRGGSTALVSGAQTAYGNMIGACYSQDVTTIEELYALGATGGVNLINKVTGAVTSLGATTFTGTGAIGRAARHFGFLHFPASDSANPYRQSVTVAGQTSSTSFTNAVVAQVAINNPQVTLTGADVTTNIKVGATVQITDATHTYLGRVVSIDTTKLFTVWPAPYWTNAAIPIGQLVIAPVFGGNGGACAASYQQRLLYGNSNDLAALSGLVADRRVYYSPLPTEVVTDAIGIQNGGATFVSPGLWPIKNYFEVPGADPIVAMESVSDNELLILTRGGVVIFVGVLATQTTTSAPGVTFDIYPLNTNAGCLADSSVQRTSAGIMWASAEGVFAYWPPLRRSPAHTGLRNMMEGKILNYWYSLVNGASFAIHGSAYVRNHYIVSGISGGVTFALACNLTSGAWAPLAAIDLFYAVFRPTIPSQVFALRFGTVGVTSFTNGQTVRYESLFAPDVAGQTKRDADGSVVAFSATSRSMTDDQQVERITRQVSVRSQSQMAAASVTANVGSRLDSTDTVGAESVVVGSLSNTSVLTVTAASNATPIVITTPAHGLQSEDQVDIHGVLGNTAANGRWRITVLSTTTFSLNQSIGNGAYTSGGDVKRVTEQEFLGTSVDIGQATWVKLDSAGTVDRFELHGVRVQALEIPRGFGR